MSCRLPVQAVPSGHAEASRGSLRLSRPRSHRASAARGAWLILAGLGWLLISSPHPATGADASAGLRVEVVVTGIPRPIQLALDAQGALVVLSHGWRGDAAAEIYRIDPRKSLPVDAARAPRVVIPFGSGAFWSWASAGRLARPTTSKLAAAAIHALVIIGVLSWRKDELSVDWSRRAE